MKRNTMIWFAALSVMVLASCGKSGRPEFGDNEYPVMTVGIQNAESETSYPATIKGVQDVEIRPKISGFITRLAIQEGQTVGRGQLLYHRQCHLRCSCASGTSHAELCPGCSELCPGTVGYGYADVSEQSAVV